MKILKLLVVCSFFLIISPLKSFCQWEQIALPLPYNTNYWLEIWFLQDDPNYGWICGFNGLVIRTTDMGKTWEGSQVGSIYHLESVCFVDKLHGFVSGPGGIYRSDDGGITWVEKTPFFGMYSGGTWGNNFLSKDYGILLGDICGYQRFFRTTNGGDSWDVFKDSVPNTALTDLYLNSDGSGFASSSGYIWNTSDSGRTWHILHNTGTNDWQEDIWHKGNTFIVPLSNSCIGDFAMGGLRASQDNGNSWNDFNTGTAMFGTFLLDENRGWGCGLNKSVYYTSNGGKTWDLENCGIQDSVDLDDLWFINDTTGFVVGDGVYKWVRLETLNPEIVPSPLISICPGDSVVITATENYKKYRWSNGDTTKSITINKPGKYRLHVENSECIQGNTKEVTVLNYEAPNPQITAFPSNNPCEGDTVILGFNGKYDKWQWSDGITSQTISVTKSGTYTIQVIDSNGCTGHDSINVTFHKNPKPEIIVHGTKNPCVGDTIFLDVAGTFSEIKWYKDNIPKEIESGSYRISPKESGSYHVEVIDLFGCKGKSEEVAISIRLDTNQLQLSFEPGEKEFNLDSVYYNNMKCKRMKIRNVSSRPAVISREYIMKNISFSVPQSQFPISIAPYDSIFMKICYSPKKFSLERDTVIIEDNCSNQVIPLKAYELPNNYSGNSSCNADISMKTIDAKGKNNYFVYEPYPNPAIDAVNVTFLFLSDNHELIPADIYDCLGRNCGVVPPIFENESEQSGKHILQGKYIIKTSDLAGGVYVIIVNAGETTFHYTIQVIK